jgi:hypothetical protein
VTRGVCDSPLADRVRDEPSHAALSLGLLLASRAKHVYSLLFHT